MEVIWSPLSLERIVEIAEAIRWDKPGAARRWVERLFATAQTLAEIPRRGRVVPELDRDDVREILVGNYRLIFRIDDEVILVLTVRHGRRILDLGEIR